MSGAELSLNRWWAAETHAAADALAKISASDLSCQLREGAWVRKGDEATRPFWRSVWRKRSVSVLKPVIVPDNGTAPDRSEGQPVGAALALPELAAIPFYGADQLHELHRAQARSRFTTSLLGRVCDADFKNHSIITALRKRRGVSRIETRGRRRRDPRTVAEVGKLIHHGLSTYEVAKKLGVAWSTAQAYHRDFEEWMSQEEWEE
jgi:hypothetical protein